MLKMGDIEAADVFWTRALTVCDVAQWSFLLSHKYTPGKHLTKALKSHRARIYELRNQERRECAAPVM